MLRRPLVPVLTLVMGALALGACGSSSGSATGGSGGAAAGSGGSGGGAGGATGGSGGATGGSGGAAGGAGGTPNFGMCAGSGNSCSQSEINDHNNCLISKCESAYTPCIGANWRTGSYGGSCGTWLKCVNDCGCGNLNCFIACGLPPAACQTCLQTASQCEMSMCPRPACYGTLPDGGASIPDGGGFNFGDGGFDFDALNIKFDVGSGTSCADLQKCCDKLPASNPLKSTCTMTASGGQDFACALVMPTFCM
jgi:hypothetical protein